MQTALISAATAAVVTLLIEYLAKPRLEARKNRIVEASRQRLELGHRFLAINYNVHLLSLDLDDERLPAVEKFRTVTAEVGRMADQALWLVQVLPARHWPTVVRPMVAARYRLDRALELIEAAEQASGQPSVGEIAQYVNEAKEKLARALDMYSLSRWRFRSYLKALRAVEARSNVRIVDSAS